MLSPSTIEVANKKDRIKMAIIKAMTIAFPHSIHSLLLFVTEDIPSDLVSMFIVA
ncbi:hypothetical protein GCM10010978_08620 [Compostibacillus humi]|uniref:Uncharacterized protein n=1 Tax=Compostibacillus humi TaxID=1245525 RepID=A0A8J2ZRQ8_9BACI|nr:hypothetical protein GCM10010978_08620 [Compostibacillus humi]